MAGEAEKLGGEEVPRELRRRDFRKAIRPNRDRAVAADTRAIHHLVPRQDYGQVELLALAETIDHLFEQIDHNRDARIIELPCPLFALAYAVQKVLLQLEEATIVLGHPVFEESGRDDSTIEDA